MIDRDNNPQIPPRLKIAIRSYLTGRPFIFFDSCAYKATDVYFLEQKIYSYSDPDRIIYHTEILLETEPIERTPDVEQHFWHLPHIIEKWFYKFKNFELYVSNSRTFGEERRVFIENVMIDNYLQNRQFLYPKELPNQINLFFREKDLVE
jgi:hypothetical protein